MISEKLGGVLDRVSSSIFFGQAYNYQPNKPWSVNLEYSYNGVKVNINEQGASLEEVFEVAWSKLDQLISRGLGASAMYAALEHKTPPSRPIINDDDIPF